MKRYEIKKGFTLAETLIVLVILGVVAAITVPALVNRHMEAERRTKLKKAMTVYDTALNKMVIENGIKSDTALTNWADSDTKNDCANTSAYFKVARNLEVNGNATNCKFRAADGVLWDISDIKKPLVALREQDLNDETAQSDTNRAFYMFGWFDENGSLRTNDLGKISATDKADLQKLYDFINGKTKTLMDEVAKETCDYLCQIQKITDECPANCEENNSCTNCRICISDSDKRCKNYYNNLYIGESIFDNVDNESYGYIHAEPECTSTNTGKSCIQKSNCYISDGKMVECDDYHIYNYDSNGDIIESINYVMCPNGDNKDCRRSYIEKPGELTKYCDGKAQNCVYGINDVKLSDYGLDSIPFSSIEFDFAALDNAESETNFTAYLNPMNGNNIAASVPEAINSGDYTNLIQVENGQPVKAGEYNPDEGTTWEADMSTGKVTFYTNCEGYKHNCTGPSQTKDISEVMGQ